MAYFNPQTNSYYNGGYMSAFNPPTQPAQNGITWVQGIEGAKSYIVPSGSTVLLMDSEAERFYIKTTDQSGMPTPIRIFEYNEYVPQTQPQTIQVDNFVTREEFERLEAKIESLTSSRKKKIEVANE